MRAYFVVHLSVCFFVVDRFRPGDMDVSPIQRSGDSTEVPLPGDWPKGATALMSHE